MKYFLVLIFMSFACFSYAQRVHYGMKVGAGAATMRGTLGGSGLSKYFIGSYNAGIFANYRLLDKIDLQVEGLFERKGIHLDSKGRFGTSDQFHYLEYLSVPVVGKFYTGDKMFVDLGLYYSFLLMSKGKVVFNSSRLSRSDYKDETTIASDGTGIINGQLTEFYGSGYRSKDFGLCLGGTYFFTEKIFIQLRYTMGLVWIQKAYRNLDRIYQMNNLTINLNAGYQF